MGHGMSNEGRVPAIDAKDADELIEQLERQDDLLADAIRRVKREQSGGEEAFFKHGEHGSHNSGG